VLDRLRRGEKARVQCGRALKFLHHFLAFLDDADDRVARLAARSLVDFFEHLLKPGDVFLGLGLVFFECGFQIRRLGGLRHLGQCAQDFFLCEVDVLESFVE
jgi:hypothetical protein